MTSGEDVDLLPIRSTCSQKGDRNMATIGRNSQGKRDFGGVALWVGQGLLAALFLFAGGFKLVASAEMMSQGPIVLPLAFLRFIGLCEVLGAIGLILPGV